MVKLLTCEGMFRLLRGEMVGITKPLKSIEVLCVKLSISISRLIIFCKKLLGKQSQLSKNFLKLRPWRFKAMDE